MTNTMIDYLDSIEVASRLLQLGGRPVTVAGLTGVPRQRCIDIYKNHNSVPPPKGMLPHAPEWFVNSEENRIQSSDVIGLYLKSLRFVEAMEGSRGCKQGLSLLFTYQRYLQIYGENRRLSLDRTWTLCRLYETGIILYFLCERCSCAFIRLLDEVQYHCIACGHSKGSHF